MSSSPKIAGQIQISTTHVFGHLMRIPTDVLGAMKELVDNCLDAGARNIWIELESDKISVQDDGHGMVPKMPDEDYQMLLLYKEELVNGKEPDDIRDLLDNPCAFASFTWAMECIGFSGKKRYIGDIIKSRRAKQGIRGIGAVSFGLIGDQQQWWSRPQGELASLFYGEQAIREGKVPVSILIPPSLKDLTAHRHSYSVVDNAAQWMREPVRGDIISGGTRIEITHLHDAVQQTLTSNNLTERLEQVYGKLIRDGICKIFIVDRTGSELKVTEVKGTRYEGTLLLKATLELKVNSRDRRPFMLEIFYLPDARRSSPDLLRAGLAVNKIGRLSEFRDTSPWNSGKLTGYVEFPQLPPHFESGAWNSAKTELSTSRMRDQWVELIQRRITPQITKKIEELDARSRSSALKNAFESAMQAANEAIKEVPELMGLRFQEPKPPRKPRGGDKVDPTIPDSVRATVIDENNVGVDGITIKLYKEDQLVVKRLTGASGTVQFGKPGVGKYRFKLFIPEDLGFYSADGVLEHEFVIEEPKQGHRMVFRVITGRKPPKRLEEKTRLEIHPVLLDESIPYTIDRMDNGVLGINHEGLNFRDAMERGDVLRQNVLLSEYIAAGLAEWSMEGYPQVHQHSVRTRVFELVSSMIVKARR